MIIVSYDISDDKLRTKFSKYLERFGHRIQFSVFEIDNSDKILDNIINDINNHFKQRFSQEDSVVIFVLTASCKVIKYGYALNENTDLKIIK